MWTLDERLIHRVRACNWHYACISRQLHTQGFGRKKFRVVLRSCGPRLERGGKVSCDWNTTCWPRVRWGNGQVGYRSIPRPPKGQKPGGKWKHWGLPHFKNRNQILYKLAFFHITHKKKKGRNVTENMWCHLTATVGRWFPLFAHSNKKRRQTSISWFQHYSKVGSLLL